MSYPSKGTLDWKILSYEECEEKGFFSGIKIGEKEIYLKSLTIGKTVFLLFGNDPKTDPNAKHGISLSPREFDFILNVIFNESEKYYINKCIWRTSS